MALEAIARQAIRLLSTRRGVYTVGLTGAMLLLFLLGLFGDYLDMAAMRAETASAQAAADGARRDAAAARGELTNAQRGAADAGNLLKSARTEIAQKNQTLAALNEQIDRLQAQAARQHLTDNTTGADRNADASQPVTLRDQLADAQRDLQVTRNRLTEVEASLDAAQHQGADAQADRKRLELELTSLKTTQKNELQSEPHRAEGVLASAKAGGRLVVTSAAYLYREADRATETAAAVEVGDRVIGSPGEWPEGWVKIRTLGNADGYVPITALMREQDWLQQVASVKGQMTAVQDNAGAIVLGSVSVPLTGIRTVSPAKAGQFAKWINSLGGSVECERPSGSARFRCYKQGIDLSEALLLNKAATVADDAPQRYKLLGAQAAK